MVFNIPFDYLRNSFVKAKIGDDGEPMEYGTDYEVANRQITFTTAPVGMLYVYRETPTDRMVQFMEGSVLKATDMNISTLQQLHIIEEAQDWTTSNAIVFNDETLAWEAKGYHITNVADPVDAQDVVTKNYLENNTLICDNTAYLWKGKNYRITNIADPTNSQDVVTKHYMETVQNGFVQQNIALKNETTTQANIATQQAERAQAWAESDNSPDGEPDSKSSKTWAAEAAQSAMAAAQSAQKAADTAAGLGNPVMEVTENNGTVTVKKADNTTDTFQTFTLDKAYPVGSIYMSVNDANPSTFFGGTWEAFGQGRVLIGAGEGTDANSVKKTFTGGATGGEYEHKLTTAEMPAHNHTASTDNTGGHTHTGTAASAGAHKHSLGCYNGSGSWLENGVDNNGELRYTATTSSAGAHTHNVTIASSGAHSHTVTVNNTGSGNAHNNLPPYVGVYFWRRTA